MADKKQKREISSGTSYDEFLLHVNDSTNEVDGDSPPLIMSSETNSQARYEQIKKMLDYYKAERFYKEFMADFNKQVQNVSKELDVYENKLKKSRTSIISSLFKKSDDNTSAKALPEKIAGDFNIARAAVEVVQEHITKQTNMNDCLNALDNTTRKSMDSIVHILSGDDQDDENILSIAMSQQHDKKIISILDKFSLNLAELRATTDQAIDKAKMQADKILENHLTRVFNTLGDNSVSAEMALSKGNNRLLLSMLGTIPQQSYTDLVVKLQGDLKKFVNTEEPGPVEEVKVSGRRQAWS